MGLDSLNTKSRWRIFAVWRYFKPRRIWYRNS